MKRCVILAMAMTVAVNSYGGLFDNVIKNVVGVALPQEREKEQERRRAAIIAEQEERARQEAERRRQQEAEEAERRRQQEAEIAERQRQREAERADRRRIAEEKEREEEKARKEYERIASVQRISGPLRSCRDGSTRESLYIRPEDVKDALRMTTKSELTFPFLAQ